MSSIPVKVDKTTLINLEKGKLPPQAIDLEEAVLGAMMIDKKGVDEAISLLTADVFYKDAHKHIYEAIFNLYESNRGVDLLTVSSELKRLGKLELSGGDFYLIGLTQKISSSAHIDFHCRIILQKYIQRKCIRVSSSIIEDSYDENVDVFELLEKAYKDLGEVTDLVDIGKESDFKQSVISYLKTSKNNTSGIQSSLTLLNKKLNGYQDTDLIILGGRPGSGKTAFTLNEVLECGLNNIPCIFFSLEMGEKQIIARMLSIISGIDNTKIRDYNLSPSEMIYLKECSDLLASLPIIIDDSSGLSPIEMKIKCSKLKREKGIKMIFVDYLQLMKVKNKKIGNREQEISEISQSLKNLAKDLNVPVLALSQLSRNVESRGSSKRPLLSDLRDSGSIEQDADIVMFIYRPEYYKIDEWDDDDSGPTTDQAEIDVAKYRHGETGYCRVGCQLKYMRFMDLEDLGNDISQRYFRNKPVPEKRNEAIPTMDPKEVFSIVDYSMPKKDDDESDIPF
jgi:replicative DNA helicase